MDWSGTATSVIAKKAKKPTRTLQQVMGGIFFSMGLGTMLMPSLVINTCFNQNYFRNSVGERVLVACFGAQSALQGVLMLSCRWHRQTWLNWGLAILPFCVFDLVVNPLGPLPVLSWLGAAGDGLANLVFLATCWIGYRRTLEDDDDFKHH